MHALQAPAAECAARRPSPTPPPSALRPQRAPWLDGRHQVFGRVTSGLELLEEISRVPVDEQYRPKLAISISDVGEIGAPGAPPAVAGAAAPPPAAEPAAAPDAGAARADAGAAPAGDAAGPADGAAAPADGAAPLALYEAGSPGDAPAVTRIVYLELEQDGEDLGRIVLGL